MKCTACGRDNPENTRFCGGCGTSLSAPAASSTGVESAALPMIEDRRRLRQEEQFCISCGEIIKKLAEICPKCGVRLKDAPASKGAQWSLAVPITSLILGCLGVFTFFDDSGWDIETMIGVLMIFGIPPIALGVISIYCNIRGKVMGIIGLVLGCISTIVLIAMLATM